MALPTFITADVSAAPGTEVVVSGAVAKHISVVSRYGEGDAIDLVDGRGSRFSGRISRVSDNSVAVSITTVSREQLAPVILVQALAKAGRDELAIEMATELGATHVYPWQAQRSIVRWNHAKAEKGRQQWADRAAAATAQSRRATIPKVGVMLDLSGLVNLVAQVVAAQGRAILLHEDAETPISQIQLPALALPATAVDPTGTKVADALPKGAICLIVGPEGGVSPAEVDALTEVGAQLARLGPHVLRASTAGAVAITAVNIRQSWWG